MEFQDDFLASVKEAMEAGPTIEKYLNANGLLYDVNEVRRALMDKYTKKVIVSTIVEKIIKPNIKR